MPDHSSSTCSLTLIGDTHLRHRELGNLSGDVLIHVGDFFDLFQPGAGSIAEIDDWFAAQQFNLILCIAGNHDFPLWRRQLSNRQVFKHAVYLEDQSIQYKGIKFHGSPWVPFLPDHAFFADDRRLTEKWAGVPDDTDVLITHTPPYGVLAKSSRGRELGCPQLAERVRQINPTLHCFGHVHASGGILKQGETSYVNAASTAKDNLPLRKPQQFLLG